MCHYKLWVNLLIQKYLFYILKINTYLLFSIMINLSFNKTNKRLKQ